MTERFGNDCNIHSRTLQNRCERMPSDIGSQMFDADPLSDFTQPAIRVRQHLMRSVISLLLRPMHTAVEYRKNIIFIRLSLLLVFDNDIPHFFRQQKIDRFARFLPNVLHPPSRTFPYFSRAMSAKLIPAPK